MPHQVGFQDLWSHGPGCNPEPESKLILGSFCLQMGRCRAPFLGSKAFAQSLRLQVQLSNRGQQRQAAQAAYWVRRHVGCMHPWSAVANG